MPKVVRPDGESYEQLSASCLKCSEPTVEISNKETFKKEHGFDENGWFWSVQMRCTRPTCKHQWLEKMYIVQGGMNLF